VDKQDDQENKRHQSKEEEEQESQILIPIVQETILFHGKPLVVVRLPNGEPGVVLRWICENLHLDTQGQVQRIQRTEVIADDLVYTRVQTEGGPQVMPTLILFSVPYWLATIDTRRMDKNDERRLEILDYQRNAVAALYAWAQSPKGEVTPPGLVPSEQVTKPAPPGDNASLDERREYHRQMLEWIDWQKDVEAWRGTVNERLEGLESITSRIVKQIGPPRITTEHQTLVPFYVSQLSDRTKKTPATIYAQLKTVFRVPRYDEIPEADWPRMEQWFRLQFPGQKLPESTTQGELF
jgi:hypothetical protein